MRTIFLFLVLAPCVLAQLMSCKDSEPPVGSDPPEVPADTNWVTHLQVDIAWPGLASSPWPMFLHDPQHTGRSAYRGPQEGRVEWMFNAGFTVYSSPAIDFDGTIYFACFNEYFFGVTSSGIEKWRSWGGGGDGSPLIASDGTIYIYGSGASQLNKSLLSYDRSGNLNWEYVIGVSQALSSPVISRDGEMIYLAAKFLHAIRKDGSLHWKLLPPDSSDAAYYYSVAMSPDGATLYVPGFKALYAVDTSGSVRWKFSCTSPGNPAVDNDGNVYFGEGSGRVYSLSSNGAVRWTCNDIFWGPMDPGPVIGRDGTIYITGQALYAIDYAGRLKWKHALPGSSQCIPAIDSAGTIYLGRATLRTPADSVNFLAVNPDGTLKFGLSLRSLDGTVPDIDSRPAISADGSLYVGSDRPRGFHVYKIK